MLVVEVAAVEDRHLQVASVVEARVQPTAELWQLLAQPVLVVVVVVAVEQIADLD